MFDESASVYDLSKEAQQRIVDLEQSLQFHKENLQATVEELETSNEELQATNEELMASNEELQSTNEELQSVNEELYTVNAEYQSKIIELTEANNDLENLYASTKIPTIFLDENLDIRKFTPSFSKIYKIIESDAGRPFSHLSSYLEDIEPYDIVKNVASEGDAVEQEVKSESGDYYLMRALPYYIAPNVYSGVVLSFINISGLKQEQKANRKSERLLKSSEIHRNVLVNAVLDSMSDGLIITDVNGKIEHINKTACSWFGYNLIELAGQNVTELMDTKDAKEHTKHMTRHAKTNEVLDGCGRDITAKHKDGSALNMTISLSQALLGGKRYYSAVVRRKE